MRFQGAFPKFRIEWLRYAVLAVALLLNPTGARGQPQDADPRFKSWDTNGDGMLTVEELPEPLRVNFQRVDRDGSGAISLAEHRAFVDRNAQRPVASATQQVAAVQPTHADVPYVEGGHSRQKLDLYLPSPVTESSLPLVVWIHGGGWQSGNRRPCPATYLVDEGFAVASLGYRLSGDAIFPAQLEDCRAAIRFLKTHAKEFHIAADRIGVWGASAGGHLAALVGTSGNGTRVFPSGAGDIKADLSIRAVCDYFGPTDLLAMAGQSGAESRIDHNASSSPESKLLGGAVQLRAELARAANPLTYVDAQDPAFLIVHGDADPLVPWQQSQLLDQSLKQAGVATELVIEKAGGHGPFRSRDQLARVATFFKKHLE